MKTQINELRAGILSAEQQVTSLKGTRMRLGKVIQAYDGGVSVYKA